MKEGTVVARKEAVRSYIMVYAQQVKDNEGIDLAIDIEAAANTICDVYVRYAEEVIRPTISSGIIQNYKIISYLEVAVMRVEPIYFPEDELRRAQYNARLAVHISLSFLQDWHEINNDDFLTLLSKDTQLNTFIQEHITWLADLDLRYYFPGFLNSQVWRLFHYLVIDRL